MNSSSNLPTLVEQLPLAKNNIKRWKDNFVAQKESLKNSLKKNVGVVIGGEQYEAWKAALGSNISTGFLHVYMGLEEHSYEPIFYLIDSASDASQNYSHLYQVQMNPITPIYREDITSNTISSSAHTTPSLAEAKETIVGMNSALRWLLKSNQWVDSKGQGEFVQVFAMKFEHVQQVFEGITEVTGDARRGLLFLALYDYRDEEGTVLYPEEINLRIVGLREQEQDGYLYLSEGRFRDVTSPHPPFGQGGQQFNLLNS